MLVTRQERDSENSANVLTFTPSRKMSDLDGCQMTDAHDIPLEAKVFAFLFQSIEAKRRVNLPAANKMIEIALRLTDGMPADEADVLRALGLCSRTLLRKKEDRPDDAAKEREEAMTLVDRVSMAGLKQDSPFPELMSAMLKRRRPSNDSTRGLAAPRLALANLEDLRG